MSRKKKSELAFELVQRTNCKANQNFVVANNPKNEEKKLRLCNLISEADCRKFTDALSKSGELEKSCFRVHSGDMRKNKDTGEIETELEHIHMALLFKTPYTFEKVSQKFQEITGKVVPPSCVCSCTYADITSTKPSDAEQYALMVTYQTHAGKKGACNELLTPWLSNDAKDIPYQLYSLPHPASWVDESTGETKQEDLEELRFIPACNPVPEGGKTICTFTSEKSKVHQNLYDPDTLNTFNTDVAECFEIRQNISQLEKEKADARQLRKEVEETLIKIRTGEIPEYQYELVVPPEIDVQMKNGQVANAYNYYYNKIKAELKAQGFKNAPAKNVMMIQGGAGSGKSSLAQEFCEANNMSYYVTSTGNHAFDDYKGEEVIILDDCRDSSYRLNELLKMLDNNTRCDIQARYHNKNLCAVKLIIITTSKHLNTWYKAESSNYDKDEQLDQLYRRIRVVFTFLKPNPVDPARRYVQEIWDREKQRYVVYKRGVYEMKPDELFKQEDIQSVAERAYQQFIAGMEHMGVKHYEEPVDSTTLGTFYSPDEYKKQNLVYAPQSPAPAPQPSTPVQPAYQQLPLPDAQSESEWVNITPSTEPDVQPASAPSTAPAVQPQYSTATSGSDFDTDWRKNLPPVRYDKAGRIFRKTDKSEKQLLIEILGAKLGYDYIIDEYGVVYVFAGWSDDEPASASDTEERMVWSEEENRYRLC